MVHYICIGLSRSIIHFIPIAMLKIIEGAADNTIAVEIVGGYETKDEKSLEAMFEEKLAAGYKQLNMLVKIEGLSLSKSNWKAMWDDSIYAMKHIRNCGRVAIVGNSKIDEFMVNLDNVFFANEKAGRIEKYFHTLELPQAMEWVNGK